MRLCCCLVLALSQLWSSTTLANNEQQQRIEALSQELNIPLASLEQAAEQATYQQAVIDAITRPWEARPWHLYRDLFLTEERLEAGLAFWQEHQVTIERAEKEFNVPAQIIVAIIGVETYYGRHKGTYPVIDALYTLGFHYPKRGQFFSKEFAYFIRLAEQQGWQLDEVKGSYAGAMGFGQFIPSSYIHYGVDFDQDGEIDMLNNPVDAIGSVANYFSEHRWKLGEPVVHSAQSTATQAKPWLSSDLKIKDSWQQLEQSGITSTTKLAAETPVKLLELEEANGHSYWLAEHNFYVITRYNRSPLYAMAVYQFSEQLREAKAKLNAK
ncbi:lytic murein transglycosylase B [Agarivorans sp. Toyoura001]|uniref:lytic murein transglycosylase B n=1 Tax=unclassified Agarivorans TaxID=2636026 RepID=UPI0010F09A34|nr:lytic murein transglycosylase B [Agarivorans sp. Toyoura001]GDY24350.1 lytic murein transglycosylase B [Agarivorans sp. Toyoura001]